MPLIVVTHVLIYYSGMMYRFPFKLINHHQLIKYENIISTFFFFGKGNSKQIKVEHRI